MTRQQSLTTRQNNLTAAKKLTMMMTMMKGKVKKTWWIFLGETHANFLCICWTLYLPVLSCLDIVDYLHQVFIKKINVSMRGNRNDWHNHWLGTVSRQQFTFIALKQNKNILFVTKEGWNHRYWHWSVVQDHSHKPIPTCSALLTILNLAIELWPHLHACLIVPRL